MALKPWYKIVTPREDLREGKPLDASEFLLEVLATYDMMQRSLRDTL